MRGDSLTPQRYPSMFEELRRFLPGAVLDRHRRLWTEDVPTLDESLYPFRKRWLDEAHRHRLSQDEAPGLAGDG